MAVATPPKWPKSSSRMRGREKFARAVLSALRKAVGRGTVERLALEDGANRIRGRVAFTICIEDDELDGGYVAECLELPGCVSQGETEDEAVENIIEAISGVLEVRMLRFLKDSHRSNGQADDHPRRRALEIPVT